MALVTHKFKLDLTPGAARQVLYTSQGDIGRPFEADLYWNGSPWTATGTTANIRGKKPDDTVFDYTATVSGTAVTFETTEQMTIISGPVECELVFSQGGDVIASANFVLMVEDSPYDPNALSESDIPTIGDLIEQTIGGDIRDEVDALIEENPELMLQDNSVTTPKIAAGAVTEGKIASNAVTTGKLATGAVTSAKVDADFLKTIENAYVTPEMFGAVGDGVTNDTSALQSAITYGAANGLEVLIPEGKSYEWRSPIFMPSNLVLRIEGELLGGNGNTVFETYDHVTETPGYTASHDVIVCGNGTINMRGGAYTTVGPTPLRIHHAKDVTIRDISILDLSMYHAIECGGTDGLTVDNVKFKGMHANGMDGWHEYIQLEDITETGTGGAIPYDGTVTKNVIVRNCYFGPGDNGGYCYTAVGTHSDPDDYFENFLIENCEIVNSMEFPLRFAEKIKDMTIRGCSITRGGGTYGRGSLYLGDDLHNIVVEGCDFGDTPGRHISLVHVAAPNGEGLTNVTIKNNVFREYGTSGQDPLGLHLAAITTNLCIKDNVFISKLATSNRPIHIPGTTINGYIDGLQIAGNVFYTKSLDADNIYRWNKNTGRTTIYDTEVYSPGTYTMSQAGGEFDKLIFWVYQPGTSEVAVEYDMASKRGLEYYMTWESANTTSPYRVRFFRLFVDVDIYNKTFTIQKNTMLDVIYTFGSDGVATETKVIPYSASISGTNPDNILHIKKVVGVSANNKVVFV